MDDLESLEILSLVTKVTSELQNHLGLSDKTLAEFIIDQHTQSASSQDFRKALNAFGAEFPPSLVDSIDRLAGTMHPKYRNEVAQSDADAVNKTEKVFKGLSSPDQEFGGGNDDEDEEEDALDDTFAALEGLAGKATRKRSASPDDRGRDRYSNKRHKDDSYSRSRSPRRDRNGHRNGHRNGSHKYVFEEDEYRRSRDGRNGHKDSRRRRRRARGNQCSVVLSQGSTG